MYNNHTQNVSSGTLGNGNKKSIKMTQFVIYTRVSTRAQGESGLGLEAQLRDINLYLTNYAIDHTIIGSFQDIASGKSTDRVEYNKAVTMAESTGSTLLVAKLDRISRDVETIAGLIKRVDLKVGCMPFADTFQLHLYAALSQQEREFISLRTKSALQAKRERGESMNNPMTFKRQDVQDKATVTKKTNATSWKLKVLPTVRRIVSTTNNYHEACKILNDLGVKTARNGNFHPTTISRIMS